jgi:phage-related minor tail protein
MTQAATPAGEEAGKAAGQSLGKSLGEGMSNVGGALTKGVTAPITAIGTASVAAWKEVDTGLDTIIQKTGASGDALDEMSQILNNLVTEIPTDFATAGAAIGQVNTRFGVTGQDLEKLSGKFVKFAQLNDKDVSASVDSVSKMMAAFGLEADDAGKMLDALNTVGQQTGADVTGLADTIAANAKQFQEMGLSAEEAASFLGQASMAGLDSGTAMMGLKTAMKNATEDGKSLSEVLSGFEDTMGSNASGSEKLAAAYELFGTRAGGAIENAVAKGTLSLSDFSSSLGDFEGSVDETFEGTLDPMDKFQTTLNELKLVGADLVDAAGPALADILTEAAEGVKTLAEAWSGLSPEMQDTIIKVAGIAAVAGPLLSIGGTIIGGISTIAGGLGGLIGQIGGVGSAAGGAAAPVASAGTSFAGMAGSALKMVAAAAALWIAAQAISTLADAAIRVSYAGTPAIAVLAGMAVGIGALMGVAAALGPALTAGAVGIGVFGASMLGIGVGVGVACAGIALVTTAVSGLVETISANAPGINSIVTNIGETAGGVCTSISEGIATVVDSISGGISGVLDSVAGIIDSIGDAAIDAGTGFEKLAGAVKDLTNGTSVFDLGSTLGAVAVGVKDINSAASGAGDSATSVSNLSKSFKTLGTDVTGTTKSFTTFSTGAKGAFDTVSKSMAGMNLGSGMRKAMSEMLSAANSGLSSLKSSFRNTHLSFQQHIDVPHFSMSGSFNAQTGSVPTVRVSGWYAKAAEYGALFTEPTIIGVGDAAQPELLLGENKLQELVGGRPNNTFYVTLNATTDESPEDFADRFVRRLEMEVRLA